MKFLSLGQLRQTFSQRWRWWVFLAGGMAALMIWSHPAKAYQVQVIPAQPELGDTLAVVIQDAPAGDAPTVTVRGRDYPTFPLTGDRYRALAPTSPLDQPGRLTLEIRGAQATRNLALDLKNRNFPTQRITLSPGRASLEGTEYEFSRLEALKSLVTPEKYWNGPMSRPSRGAVSSVYGVRRYYNGVYAQDYYHRGVDYTEGEGAPIYAPAAGRVELTGRVEDGFVLNGNTIGIDHGQGVVSVLIHLSRIDVREGDFVQAGQLIGRMGSTGFATGPNLHWGLYVNGVAVDPVPWRYDGIE